MIPGGSLGAAATVGFSEISLNIIEITPGPMETVQEKKEVVLDIAHEIGHVFGLRHEHQRADRDQYVHFNCSNLKGYEEAIQEIKKPGNKHTIDEVCDREDFCRLYKFSEGEEYAIKQYVGSNGIKTIQGKSFDLDSIMLYNSFIYSKQILGKTNPKNAPLVKWKNGRQNARTEDDCELIPEQDKISDGDRDGVKLIYPCMLAHETLPKVIFLNKN